MEGKSAARISTCSQRQILPVLKVCPVVCGETHVPCISVFLQSPSLRGMGTDGLGKGGSFLAYPQGASALVEPFTSTYRAIKRLYLTWNHCLPFQDRGLLSLLPRQSPEG